MALARRTPPPPPPFVLVPLYIYPAPQAWEPLVQAARAHRGVRFVAVVNPADGPGRDALPDAAYRAALARLAAEPNIATLGYVHCGYGRRDAAAVAADVDAYRGWAAQAGRLAPGGIFVDEAPAGPEHAAAMAALAARVKQAWRRDGREATVVLNPGVVPAPALFACGADYLVVFEAAQAQWDRLRAPGQDLRRLDAAMRARAVAIVHSTRAGASGPDAAAWLQQARALGLAGVYATDQPDGGYTRWPAAWSDFAAAVSRC